MQAVHANAFLVNLAMVLCVAAATTVVFQKLRQPLVLGYIIAGLLVGPYVPFPLVADSDTIHGLSELGVILLLFGIGLEFTFRKLVRVGAAAAVVALVEISVQIILGDVAAKAFGWTSREALFAGAMMAMSSTTIIAKAFDEMKVGGRVRELVLAVLIVEDLVAILLLTALSTLTVGSLSAGQLGMTAARLFLFLAVVFGAGMLVVPRLVRAVVKLDRPETTSIACVGICFAFALLAQRFDYSVALGAFLAGSLVAESGEGVRVEQLIEPVRDLFGAVFFVSVGMLIDPKMVAANWLPILVLSAVVVAGRIVGVSIPAFFTGEGVRNSIAASMSMAQIGEFSFLIAQMGVATGAIREFLYPVAVSVSAVTTLTTPWMIRAAGPASAWVDRKLPHALQTFVALYGSWIDGLRAPGPRKTRVQRQVRLLAVDAALLGAIVIAAAHFFARLSGWAMARLHLGPRAADALVVGASMALSAPFLVGVVRLAGALAVALAGEALPGGGKGRVDLAAAPRRALIVSLQLAIAIALGLPFFAVARTFLPLAVVIALFVAGAVALGVRLWRSVTDLQGHVRAGAQVLAEAFAGAVGDRSAIGRHSEEEVHLVVPGLGSPVRVAVGSGSAAIGRTLAELNLRGTTGATVLAILRGGDRILVPTGHEQLHEGDVLALAGTHDSIGAARGLISAAVVPGDAALPG